MSSQHKADGGSTIEELGPDPLQDTNIEEADQAKSVEDDTSSEHRKSAWTMRLSWAWHRQR
jgi:hypothetical protein